jgi:hypothetical protein
MVADASGNGVGKAAGERFFADRREGRFVLRFQTFEEVMDAVRAPAFGGESRGEHAPHIGPAQPQKVRAGEFPGQRVAEQHAGGFAGQPPAFGETRVGQRLGRHVQREPVRQVRRAERAAHHAKRDAVKFVALDYRGLDRVGAVGRAGVGGPVIGRAQPLRRQPAEGPALRQRVFPQFTRRARVRIDAGHAHDGDCWRSRLHVWGAAWTSVVGSADDSPRELREDPNAW